jgi:hypothetical protein
VSVLDVLPWSPKMHGNEETGTLPLPCVACRLSSTATAQPAMMGLTLISQTVSTILSPLSLSNNRKHGAPHHAMITLFLVCTQALQSCYIVTMRYRRSVDASWFSRSPVCREINVMDHAYAVCCALICYRVIKGKNEHVRKKLNFEYTPESKKKAKKKNETVFSRFIS